MFEPISLTSPVTVRPDLGTFKRCAECGGLFRAATPGLSCAMCDTQDMIDVTEPYHILHPETRFLPRILIERPDPADLFPDE